MNTNPYSQYILYIINQHRFVNIDRNEWQDTVLKNEELPWVKKFTKKYNLTEDDRKMIKLYNEACYKQQPFYLNVQYPEKPIEKPENKSSEISRVNLSVNKFYINKTWDDLEDDEDSVGHLSGYLKYLNISKFIKRENKVYVLINNVEIELTEDVKKNIFNGIYLLSTKREYAERNLFWVYEILEKDFVNEVIIDDSKNESFISLSYPLRAQTKVNKNIYMDQISNEFFNILKEKSTSYNKIIEYSKNVLKIARPKWLPETVTGITKVTPKYEEVNRILSKNILILKEVSGSLGRGIEIFRTIEDYKRFITNDRVQMNMEYIGSEFIASSYTKFNSSGKELFGKKVNIRPYILIKIDENNKIDVFLNKNMAVMCANLNYPTKEELKTLDLNNNFFKLITNLSPYSKKLRKNKLNELLVNEKNSNIKKYLKSNFVNRKKLSKEISKTESLEIIEILNKVEDYVSSNILKYNTFINETNRLGLSKVEYNKVFKQISEEIIPIFLNSIKSSLKCRNSSVNNNEGCFKLFVLDIHVDENLNAYFIEGNGNPGVSSIHNSYPHPNKAKKFYEEITCITMDQELNELSTFECKDIYKNFHKINLEINMVNNLKSKNLRNKYLLYKEKYLELKNKNK